MIVVHKWSNMIITRISNSLQLVHFAHCGKSVVYFYKKNTSALSTNRDSESSRAVKIKKKNQLQ